MIEAILLSLIVAYVRKGNIRRLGELDLRHTWLIFAAAVFIGLLFIFTKYVPGMAFLGRLTSVSHLAAYLVALIVIVLNRRLPGMALVGLGAALNFAVISVNGGKMPVSYEAAKYANMEKALRNDLVRHCRIDENTRLAVLADVIPLKWPSFHPGVMSVGDIILDVGLFVLVQYGVCPRKRSVKELVGGADPAG
ncbi:MAG: DUF5317 domain-containing protein [Armatimonadota bacterium]|nr:DUF5317 domain-containing protein [Armatimonadota bacterium]